MICLHCLHFFPTIPVVLLLMQQFCCFLSRLRIFSPAHASQYFRATGEHHLQDVLGASPVHGPPMMAGDKVMHYAMNIGDSTLMLSDAMDGQPDALSTRAYVYVEDVDAVCKKATAAGMCWLHFSMSVNHAANNAARTAFRTSGCSVLLHTVSIYIFSTFQAGSVR